MPGSGGDDQILDVELWEIFRGDCIITNDRNRDTEEAYVLVEVVGEGVEVVDHQHFNRDRKFLREGIFCLSIFFYSGCECRLSRCGDRLRHGLSRKTRAMGSGS